MEYNTRGRQAQYGRVHGKQGLGVADAFTMPDYGRGNTYVTTRMIGERLLDFFRNGLNQGFIACKCMDTTREYEVNPEAG